MTLHNILKVKGSHVHSIHSGASLDDVVQKLVQNNCGALVVCEPPSRPDLRPGHIEGIITERDILRACASRQGPLETMLVSHHMTSEVITGRLSDTLEATMGLMTERRIRHLPVIDGGELAGIISIGDVVKAQHAEMMVENHYLKSYIQS